MRHPSSTPTLHRDFLDRSVPLLAADRRIAGIAAAGSYAENAMDEFSDVDLVLACEPKDAASLMRDRPALAARLGPLVAAFTGEHVAEPRLLICLYGPPALHVDMKVVPLAELETRVDDPVVLWERSGQMTAAYATTAAAFPDADPQWIEDRFWGLGALRRAQDRQGGMAGGVRLPFLSSRACPRPLGLRRAGLPPTGVRRVERHPELAELLAATVAGLERRELLRALRNAVDAYRELRPAFVRCQREAEAVALTFVDQVVQDTPRST